MAINYPIGLPFGVPIDHHINYTFESGIYRLDEIVELPVNVPHYTTCHTSIVATGLIGSAPGELWSPRGAAIHEETHQIFIANFHNDRVEIYSETGDFFSQLGVGQLHVPHGVAIHGDCVYVSCWDHTVSKFSLTEMCRVRKIGGWGSNNGQFMYPHQLTTDLTGRVFIADIYNDRICIYDPDLNHLRNITHQSISRPYDVKVSRDLLCVLCPDNNQCMHVLILEEDKLHSHITLGEGLEGLRSLFFCLDPLNNFVLTDWKYHSIHVFSPEGNLLHTIRKEDHQPGMFYNARGLTITPNGRLICVSDNENYGLQIFN